MHSLVTAKLTSAAITVQSMFRSWKCQKELMLRREQAEQAQIVPVAIEFKYSSIVVLQRWMRGFLVRAELKEASHAAKIIQRFWKSYYILLKMKLLRIFHSMSGRDTTQSISNVARTLLPRDSRRLNRIREIAPNLPRHHECGVFVEEVLNSVTVVIQSAARMYLARRILSELNRKEQANMEEPEQIRFSTDDENELFILAPIYKRARAHADTIMQVSSLIITPNEDPNHLLWLHHARLHRTSK
jgi:hypothetical protein